MQEYLLVSQDKIFIEQYVRQAREKWIYIAMVRLESSLSLSSIECALSLKAIYDKTD
ncbi:MAG TPA: hypothetical protein VGC89_08395 [Pyrinomonadaceae bacterium]